MIIKNKTEKGLKSGTPIVIPKTGYENKRVGDEFFLTGKNEYVKVKRVSDEKIFLKVI